MNKTSNRKVKYFGEYFNYQDEKLKINSNDKKGIYKEILIKTIEQLDKVNSHHKRTT